MLFSIFTFSIMINAFNLIDGIDGLAGVFSIIFKYIIWYLLLSFRGRALSMIIFCVIISGALLSFLYYNLSENKKKKNIYGGYRIYDDRVLLVLRRFIYGNFLQLKTKKEKLYTIWRLHP